MTNEWLAVLVARVLERMVYEPDDQNRQEQGDRKKKQHHRPRGVFAHGDALEMPLRTPPTPRIAVITE